MEIYAEISKKLNAEHPHDYLLPEDNLQHGTTFNIFELVTYGKNRYDDSYNNIEYEYLYCNTCKRVVYKQSEIDDLLDFSICNCGNLHEIKPTKTDIKTYLFNYKSSITQNKVKNNIISFTGLVHDNVRKNKEKYNFWKKHKKSIIENMIFNKKMEILKTGFLANEDIYYKDQKFRKTDIENYFQYTGLYRKYKKEIKKYENPDFSLKKFVIEEFNSWKQSIEDTKCYVIGKSEKKHYAFEVFNRYSPEYSKKLMEYYQPLHNFDYFQDFKGKWHDLSKSVFLTLTYDHKKIDLEQAWESISNDWNRFKTRLFQIIPKKPYIMVVEAQKNGYPHIHAVFLGISYLLKNGTWNEYKTIKKRNEKPSIQNIWKMGLTWINKTEEDKEIIQPISYMYKYYKSITGTKKYVNTKGYLTQCFLWFFNRRSYNISQELNLWLREHQTGIIEDINGKEHYQNDIDWIGLLIYDNQEIRSLTELLNILNMDCG